MFAQINHMAMVSTQYPMLQKFYEAVFGLRISKKPRPERSVSIGDGYVGLNILPRRDGYFGGLDHFGMVVDNVDAVLERMQRKDKRANIVKRPSTRPFAAYSGNDPDGNVFDLAQKKNDTRIDIYSELAEEGWAQDRYLNKFAIRTLNPDACADFYQEVFELEPVQPKSNAPGRYLTDGRVTLALLPWNIGIFEGMGIKHAGPDHLGFKVENIEAFKAEVQRIGGGNPYLAPVPLGGSKESDVRRKHFENSATGKYQMADPDGNWIDINDE
jgi:catechol 2,3-dioxygenase-like lactoylglutathione lyase family enzyme